MLGIKLGALEARGTGFRDRGGGAGPVQWGRRPYGLWQGCWTRLLCSPPRDLPHPGMCIHQSLSRFRHYGL